MFEDIERKLQGEAIWSSDLACERRRADTDIAGVEFKKEISCGFLWERIEITSESGAHSIGRPCGTYDTLNLPRMDTMDDEGIEDAANEVAKELCTLLDKRSIYPERLLIVGLGNAELTPDMIGPLTAKGVNATMHIRNFDEETFDALECSEIAVLETGVTANSGMEAADLVIGVCDRIEPDAVLAIDALASSSADRLGTTIQISDTGIFPGGGIGNRRHPINERILGIPVIAIGVPTVVDSRVFLHGEGVNGNSKAKSREGVFVCPQQIDGIVHAASKIISTGINQAFGVM